MKEFLRFTATTAGGLLPEPALFEFVRKALGADRVALCCHRVNEDRRFSELDPRLTLEPETLDALITFLRATRGGSGDWLTVSFDDGYEDAALYLASRAPRWPDVEWLFFVCPEKVERQAGFRWDAAEQCLLRGVPPGPDVEAHAAVEDVAAENLREDLLRVSRAPEYRLADVALCQGLQRLPGVTLGNHTNGHFHPKRLRPEQVTAEYDASVHDFTRLFGPQEHFAFPFGTPGYEFDASHVEALRAHGRFLLWSTLSRTYAPAERRPGAVLPRFVIDGTHSWQQSAFLIAAHALSHRKTAGAWHPAAEVRT